MARREYYTEGPEFDECSRLIATYYERGLYEECFDGHLVLARKGYPLAQCQVGWFYSKGLGVEENPEQAFFWTEQAAQNGDHDAQCNLAEFYTEGYGTAVNTEKAAYWYSKAAAQGDKDAIRRCKELGIWQDEIGSAVGDAHSF